MNPLLRSISSRRDRCELFRPGFSFASPGRNGIGKNKKLAPLPFRLGATGNHEQHEMTFRLAFLPSLVTRRHRCLTTPVPSHLRRYLFLTHLERVSCGREPEPNEGEGNGGEIWRNSERHSVNYRRRCCSFVSTDNRSAINHSTYYSSVCRTDQDLAVSADLVMGQVLDVVDSFRRFRST